jgi:hypothetical protein
MEAVYSSETYKSTWRYSPETNMSVIHSVWLTVLWDIAPCSLVQIDRRFRSAYWLHYRSGDGGIKDL